MFYLRLFCKNTNINQHEKDIVFVSFTFIYYM